MSALATKAVPEWETFSAFGASQSAETSGMCFPSRLEGGMVLHVIAQARDDKTNKVEEQLVCTISASDISEAQRRVELLWPRAKFEIRVTDKWPAATTRNPR